MEENEEPRIGQGKPGPGRNKAPLDLSDEQLEQISQLYADGGSDIEVRVLIRRMRGSFSTNLFERWLKEEPRFSETINRGREEAEANWMEFIRGHRSYDPKEGRRMDPKAVEMTMMNRFGWNKKQELEIPGGLSVSFDGAKSKGRNGNNANRETG